MKKYKNFSNTVIIALCLLLNLIFISACTTPPDIRRIDDFQISAKFFAEGKPLNEITHYSSSGNYAYVTDMNNQKFLSTVKSVSYDRYEGVRKFFEKEKYFSPRACDNYGQTALMWACWGGDYKMVKLLLNTKAEKSSSDKKKFLSAEYINQTSNNGYTALFCSAFHGNDEIMLYLLDYGASLSSAVKDFHGENLLHKMAKSGKASNMYSILYNDKYGVDSSYHTQWRNMFYQQDKSGYTPFHYAIVKNDTQMVLMLLEMERKAKWSNDEPIVNMYANMGKQRVYPIYTAYKVKNPSIFEQLLNDKRLDINIRFPDGNAEHDYEGIGEDFDLAKRGKYIFQEKKKNTSTYITLETDDNIFSEMFGNREEWEVSREGKLDVAPANVKKRRARVIEIIELGTDDGVPLKISEITRKLSDLKKDLKDLNGIGYAEGKDLLELAVMNDNFVTAGKIEVLKWLLKNDYHPLDADNDILYFCLHNFNGNNDLFEIAEFLINNKWEYKGCYSFQRLGRESYVQIMTNPNIREKNSWPKLKKLLETIATDYSFDEEKVAQNISCAVIGKVVPTNVGSLKDFPQYALEFFNFFRNQYTYEIRIDSTPLCSWFFKIGFDKGIDEILNDEKLARDLRVDTMHDLDKKRFIDLLNKTRAVDEQRQAKIAEWKEKYEKIFSVDSPQKTGDKAPMSGKTGKKSKSDRRGAKADKKEFKNSVEEENVVTEITE